MIVSMEQERAKRAKLTCSVSGCEKESCAQGLCMTHRRRWLVTGTTDPAPNRVPGYVPVKQKPHYEKWRGLKKRTGGVAPEWADQDRFVADVGPERPGWALVAVRLHESIGPDNFQWALIAAGVPRPNRRRLTCTFPGCAKRHRCSGYCDYHYDRLKNTGSPNPPGPPKQADPAKKLLNAKRRKLRIYGLTPEQFDAMVERQRGMCAICEEVPERGLFVDHCHASGDVRELLCARCNTMLGISGESADVLSAAIGYLARHQNKKLRVVK